MDEPKEIEARQPEPEDFRFLIEHAWADIHHSRVQEWTALGVVAGVHIGILQLLDWAREISAPARFATLVNLGLCIGLLFSILGILITCRHRHLMMVKLGWISQAEGRLGLAKGPSSPYGIIPSRPKAPTSWKGLSWPRFLSTSWFIIYLYILLSAFDVVGMIVFAGV